MRQWEYLRLDLNDAPRRSDGIDVLNQTGSEGWELVTVTGNGVALLKREVMQVSRAARRKATDPVAAE
jgi:hypothetical protein